MTIRAPTDPVSSSKSSTSSVLETLHHVASFQTVPASASFKITGYDRIAKHYGCDLVPLERRPIVRYMLPKMIMKEILIPDTFDDIVNSDAFCPEDEDEHLHRRYPGLKNAMDLFVLPS